MNTSRQRGFNILELMVGVTVLAILLGIGVPSFTQLIRNNRAVSQSNDLVSALNYARSEALKRGIRVSVCPASGAACSGADDWNTGILVFDDDTGTAGALDVSDETLQSWPAYTNNLVASGPTSISFMPNGAQAAGTIDIYKSGCTGPQTRRISVAITGRIGLTKENCS